jgi:DNA-binding CsgD family transcriptional regulator
MAFDLLGLAAAVVGKTGQPIAMNARFERLMPKVVMLRGGRLRIENPAADASLTAALDRINTGADPAITTSIALPAAGSQPPTLLQVVPIPAAMRDRFGHGAALLLAIPIAPAQVPEAALLQSLFRLTPAEARVARAIGERKTVEEAARQLGSSRETVRSHLKAALSKVGASRNIDLAIVLAIAGHAARTGTE